MNEDAYFGRLGEHALVHQGGRAYWILDDATFVRPDVPRTVAAVGETLAELERELGMPEGSLDATRRRLQPPRRARRGPAVPQAGGLRRTAREPPFGALDCTVENSLYAAFTLGGLAHRRGRRASSTAGGPPIPGLYGAGRATACLAAPGYASGLSLGDGTFFGRRAGSAAAARARR